MVHGILEEILVLLALAVVGVALFRRLGLPAVLAYLAIGAAIGPYGLGWIPDNEGTRFLAEFGVVFLLFTIGLEFSLPQLVAMRGAVLGVGGLQVLLSTAAGAGGAWLAGLGPEGAFVVGAVLALSSTAMVTRQLAEQLELNSRHGRVAVGVLLFQDLAVIPFLIVISTLGGGAENGILVALAWGLVKGAAAVAVMLAAGHWLLRPLFHEIAAARSAELFTMTALLVTLLAAWATHQLGLSMALGAFLAGMMLGETEFRHQIEADIRPFRDVLLGLFFVTVGMLLNLQVLPEIWPWVVLVVATLIVFKLLLVMGLALGTGLGAGSSLRAGVVLAQGGEFGFAMLSLALDEQLMGGHAAQVVLASIIVSMALAPILIRYNGYLAKRLFPVSYGEVRTRTEETIARETTGLQAHVIICGYGRIGQNIARFLETEHYEFVALDLDPRVVREARAAGETVFYGDSTHREILHAAGLPRARALVVSFDEPLSTMKILQHTAAERPDMPVLVRTRDDSNLERFQQAGATEVVPETLEASIMLASHLLMLLDVPSSRVMRDIANVRGDRYRLLRGFFHGEEPEPLEGSDRFRERLQTVTLPPGAHAVGRTLAELALDDLGIEVTAVRRGGIRGPQPEPETTLRERDVLVLYGTPERLERAEAKLLKG